MDTYEDEATKIMLAANREMWSIVEEEEKLICKGAAVPDELGVRKQAAFDRMIEACQSKLLPALCGLVMFTNAQTIESLVTSFFQLRS